MNKSLVEGRSDAAPVTAEACTAGIGVDQVPPPVMIISISETQVRII